MKFTIKRLDGEVAFETDAESMAQAMELAVTARADLSRADLSRADLSRADLSRASLHRADLSGADLSDANLYDADLSGANLYGADMYGANLSGADLYGADLSRASLHRANLYGASLSRADLYGADLSRADGIISIGPCDGWWVYAVRHEDGPRFAVGCRWKTLAEAREYWSGKHDRAQVLRAIEYAAAEAAARGWEVKP